MKRLHRFSTLVYTTVLLLICQLAAVTNAAAWQEGAADPAATPPAKGGQDPVKEAPEDPFPRAVKVPEGILEGGTEWLNTSHPIDLKDLKGKVVVLDFWTYCCINCMHVLPDLKFLEEKYGNQLVVIGVHSAKFDNEKDSKNIRDAIMRYDIQHPVVNDSDMIIWRKFGTRAWPTLALIDPEGRYCGSQSGEGNRELFDNVIGKLIEYHRFKGTLDETPLVFQTEASKVQPTPLRYPGKILADNAGQRLFITDSNHNRIVVTSFTGELQHVIGTGNSGRKDGSFEEAEFNHPQGTVLVGNTLYVADTENHLIRTVNLDSKTVATLAGTGQQGSPGMRDNGGLLETALNSPWSICHTSGTLYIAMAGPHQIWSHVIGSPTIAVFAGTGREDVINGALLASAFAQPSEIVADADGKYLYLVDSEGSAIRKIATDPSGAVTTIAGTSELPQGQSLFAFGDIDATGADARFQHPLGIAIHGSSLLVADSYNHKIRQIDMATGTVTTLLGNGKPGNGTDQLSEPGGLTVSGDTLFIADTNNHRILSVAIASKDVRVLDIAGLSPPRPPKKLDMPDGKTAIAIDAQQIASGTSVAINVQLTIPEGHKRNDIAPVTWELFTEGEHTLVGADAIGVRDEAMVNDQNVASLTIPLTGQPGSAILLLRISYGYCSTGDNAVCRLASATFRIPVSQNTDGGQGTIALTFPIPDAGAKASGAPLP